MGGVSGVGVMIRCGIGCYVNKVDGDSRIINRVYVNIGMRNSSSGSGISGGSNSSSDRMVVVIVVVVASVVVVTAVATGWWW